MKNKKSYRARVYEQEDKRHEAVAHIMNRIWEVEIGLVDCLGDVNIPPEEQAERFSELVELYESDLYAALEEEHDALNRAFSAMLPYTPLYVYTGMAESLEKACANDGEILFSGQGTNEEIEVYVGFEFCDADYTEIRLDDLQGIMKLLNRPAILYHLCLPCGNATRYCFELDDETVQAILKGDLTRYPKFEFVGNPYEEPDDFDI